MIHRIHELVWGPWLLVLFLGIGIIYTVKSGFFQIRRLPYWWKMTIGSIREEELEEDARDKLPDGLYGSGCYHRDRKHR